MNKYQFLILIFLVILSVSVCSCSGINLSQRIVIDKNSDWLMCGGNPQQQNISNSLLTPPFNLLWTYDCDAGIGYSSVSVSDAVLLVNTLQGEMQSIDLSTGKQIGKLNFLGNDANTTPLIIDDKVIIAYAGDKNYSLASYDFLKRDIDWRINLGYIQTSPILEDSCIYVGSLNGKEYSIGFKSGNIIWEFDTKSAIHSTSALKDYYLVFGADNGYLYCLNAKNGNEMWKIKTGASLLSNPMIFEDFVYIGSYDSNYYAISLDSGKIKWQNNLRTKIFSGSALYKNISVIFGGIDGILYSLDLVDGHILWKYPTAGVITSTPLVSGKLVYFTSFDWFAYCLNADDGKMLWNYQLDGKGKSQPVIWKNYLFVSADKYLYCLSKNGRN